MNSLCFLTLSKDCEDLQGRKFLLDVRIVSRKDCLSAFVCTTSLIKECFLEVLGTDRVTAHVKEYLCNICAVKSPWQTSPEQGRTCLTEGILSCTSLLRTNDANQLRNKRFFFFLSNREISLFEFLSFQHCCLLTSAELKFYGQTPKASALTDRPDIL